MNAIVKKDSIWIKPVPIKSIPNGIRIMVPKESTPDLSGDLWGNIVKGQVVYKLPFGITADDVTDIELGAKRTNL